MTTPVQTAEGFWPGLFRAFRQHPVATTAMATMAGVGFLANQHHEVRAALLAWFATAFSTVPSGWILLSFFALCVWVYKLHVEVRACHDDRAKDKMAWDLERARLEEKVDTSHDMVSQMFARAVKDRDEAEARAEGDRRQKNLPVELDRRKPVVRKPRSKPEPSD